MKVFFTDRNFVTREVEKRFESVDNLLEAEALVTWTDITKTERDQVMLAKALGIPSIVIQHGRRAIVDYLPDYNDINSNNTNQKIVADYFCCWGKRDYDDMIKEGYTDKQIKWTGSPLIPNFPDTRDPKLITFLSHHDVRKDAVEYNHAIHETLIKHYGNKRVKLSDKEFPAYNMIMSSQYDNEKLGEYVCKYKKELVYESEINERKLKKEDLTDLSYAKVRIDSAHQKAWHTMASILMNTKVCVSVMPSSFEGLAAVMDIPIVRVKCDWGVRDTDGKVDYELNEAAEPTVLSKLIKTIKDTNAQQRKGGRAKIASQEMTCKGDPIDNIERVIHESKNNNPG